MERKPHVYLMTRESLNSVERKNTLFVIRFFVSFLYTTILYTFSILIHLEASQLLSVKKSQVVGTNNASSFGSSTPQKASPRGIDASQRLKATVLMPTSTEPTCSSPFARRQLVKPTTTFQPHLNGGMSRSVCTCREEMLTPWNRPLPLPSSSSKARDSFTPSESSCHSGDSSSSSSSSSPYSIYSTLNSQVSP